MQKFPFKGADSIAQIHPGWPETREKLASLLRATKTLISYDDTSAIVPEALICGCEVKIVTAMGSLQEITAADVLEKSGFDVNCDVVDEYYATYHVERLVRSLQDGM